jgi:hypothetical protein
MQKLAKVLIPFLVNKLKTVEPKTVTIEGKVHLAVEIDDTITVVFTG